MSVSPEAFAGAGSMEELYGLLDAARIGAGWNKPTPSLYPAPRREFVPAHWSYALAKPALDAAGRYVSTELAERRNLILANPIEGNTYATARTLVAAYQMVKGGESARSHRHTPNALRLAVDTDAKVYTVVQGEKIPMEPGDVLLTPNWLWHGHANESQHDAYWIDFLDAPLVQHLDPMFFEHHADVVEQTDVYNPASPMRFAYSETGPKVRAAPEGAPGVRWLRLEQDALSTIELHLRHMAAGVNTSDLRTTANRIYAVIEGEGTTRTDAGAFAWARGDVFVIPAWTDANWTIGSEACLLSVSDSRLLEKLGWLKTEETAA